MQMILLLYVCCAPTKDDVASVMNYQIKLLGQWTEVKMRLNYYKSSVMWFGFSNQWQTTSHPTIMLDDVLLTVVSKQCYFGLIFDDHLSWSNHVAKVCKSMSYYLYLLLKNQRVIKHDLLKTLTESLVLSI